MGTNKRIAEFPEVWQRVDLPGKELLQTSVFSVRECWTIHGEALSVGGK
jgi:hypothetical protein